MKRIDKDNPIVNVLSELLTAFAILSAIIALGIAIPSPANAEAPGGDCYNAINIAAQETGVPGWILRGIARTESGRYDKSSGSTSAWPWAINNAGESYFPANWAESLAIIKKLQKRGETNIDVGCMQLNMRWHSQNFDDTMHMLDAYANVSYAARFLANLKKRHGNWAKAIACYHNCADQQKQQRYISTFLSKID